MGVGCFALPLGLPEVDRADTITVKQIGWWLTRCANDETVPNLISPGRFDGTAKAGVSWRPYKNLGLPIMQFDGGANAYVDLGTAALIDGSTPFTLAWWENPGTSSGAPGAFVFCPSNAASQKFIVLRYDGAAYKYLLTSICNGPDGSFVPRFATAPSLASSVGVPRLWVLRGSLGMASQSPSAFRLNVDGTDYTASAAGTGLSGFTGTTNYIGWDSLDDKWTGGLGNVRLWGRQIEDKEIERLRGEPLAGLLVPE